MANTKINIKRLQTFAMYLQEGELKSTQFFHVLSQGDIVAEELGLKEFSPILFAPIIELPHIFPKDWVYNKDFQPFWKENKEGDTFSSVISWFQINDQIFEHLFCSGLQLPELYGGRKITGNSSPADLAFNIKELIKRTSKPKVNNDYKIFLN